MPYLGQVPLTGNYNKLDSITGTFNSSNTTFNLTANSVAMEPVVAPALLVSLNGVLQQPNTDYTISGSTFTFTTPPANTDECFIIVMGGETGIGTPSDGTVTAAKIAAGAVDSSEIASGAIDLAHMSVNSIDSDQYVDGSIDNAHLAANSVDSDQYVDGSIDLAHMSSESVDEDNLYISNAGSNDQFLQKQSGNSGGLTWATPSGGGATGGGTPTEQIFLETETTIDQTYTISSGYNASTAGPVTIASGVTVTIPSGSVWVII